MEIKLIVYDFDGVMTNNKVYVDQNGNETVQVNRADGLGISEFKKLGINCLQGIENKKTALSEYCNKNNISLQNVAYVGNDINDKEGMGIAGKTYCPADAHDSIKSISDYILKTNGGDGVIRELLDFINNKKGE